MLPGDDDFDLDGLQPAQPRPRHIDDMDTKELRALCERHRLQTGNKDRMRSVLRSHGIVSYQQPISHLHQVCVDPFIELSVIGGDVCLQWCVCIQTEVDEVECMCHANTFTRDRMRGAFHIGTSSVVLALCPHLLFVLVVSLGPENVTGNQAVGGEQRLRVLCDFRTPRSHRQGIVQRVREEHGLHVTRQPKADAMWR